MSNNTLVYRFEPTYPPETHRKLKIEINCKEHLVINGFREHSYNVHSGWFAGQSTLVTYDLNELVGTKLCALYQRRKGCDLFDLYLAASHSDLDVENALACFEEYIAHSDKRVPTRIEYQDNLSAKMKNALFVNDMSNIIHPAVQYDIDKAFTVVSKTFIEKMR